MVVEQLYQYVRSAFAHCLYGAKQALVLASIVGYITLRATAHGQAHP